MSFDFAIQKIREGDPDHLFHVLRSFPADLFFTKALAYDGSNNVEYIGYALPGSSKAAPVWMIKKITYSSGLATDEQFAGGEGKFNQVWNDRASLSYS